MKSDFANFKFLLSVGPAQKPDATEHSLNIENDESVFGARLSHSSKSADFYGSLEALPGSISEDGNIVPCWQGLLNRGHLWSLKNLGLSL